eukprot:39912-Eustigmatos_ZCMA.PRE.1
MGLDCIIVPLKSRAKKRGSSSFSPPESPRTTKAAAMRKSVSEPMLSHSLTSTTGHDMVPKTTECIKASIVRSV